MHSKTARGQVGNCVTECECRPEREERDVITHSAALRQGNVDNVIIVRQIAIKGLGNTA